MEKVQKEVMLALLLMLHERGLLSKDLHNSAREAALQKSEWPEWFRDCGT